MTDDMMTLQTLLARQPDADVLREMIGFAAQRPMEIEVGERPAPPTANASPTD
jgi:hypothetical protein